MFQVNGANGIYDNKIADPSIRYGKNAVFLKYIPISLYKQFWWKNVLPIVVSIIILIPDEIHSKQARELNTQLIAMEAIINPAKILFFFAGGIITAINIPYSPTLNALTILGGRILPISTPR